MTLYAWLSNWRDLPCDRIGTDNAGERCWYSKVMCTVAMKIAKFVVTSWTQVWKGDRESSAVQRWWRRESTRMRIMVPEWRCRVDLLLRCLSLCSIQNLKPVPRLLRIFRRKIADMHSVWMELKLEQMPTLQTAHSTARIDSSTWVCIESLSRLAATPVNKCRANSGQAVRGCCMTENGYLSRWSVAWWKNIRQSDIHHHLVSTEKNVASPGATSKMDCLGKHDAPTSVEGLGGVKSA